MTMMDLKDDPHLNIVVSHAQGNLVTLWAIVNCQVLFIQAKTDSPAPHAARPARNNRYGQTLRRRFINRHLPTPTPILCD